MPEWSAETPLRVVTGYHSIAERFFRDSNFEHVLLLAADGALEAHPAMGSADIILDLVHRPATHTMFAWASQSCAPSSFLTSRFTARAPGPHYQANHIDAHWLRLTRACFKFC